MPKRGQRDDSPGDDRKPFSDVGGPAGKHAQTHDVRREQLTNPKGLDRSGEEFAADLQPERGGRELGGHATESRAGVDDKKLHQRLPDLTDAELANLAVLERGARLEQGGVYLDLNDPQRKPFRALGGQVAEEHNRFIAKRETDYELWNRLAGQHEEPELIRPETEQHASSN